MAVKMHTSVKGEKKYNICGVQDMLPAAQEKFTKGDAPPSARHIFDNDKKYLQGFERGRPPKGGGGPEFLAESAEMWNCMAGHERPLDKWRAMTARGDNRRSMLSTPTESEYSMTPSQLQFRDSRERGSRTSRASVTSSQLDLERPRWR